MFERLQIVYRLGVKELFSLRYDPVLVILIFYTFTVAIYSVAKGVQIEVANAAVAVVDEDRSVLSRRVVDGLREPYFQPPVAVEIAEVDAALDDARFTFLLDIPPSFERDVLAGRRPAVQLNIDATAMSQAGNGARYVEAVVAQEVASYLQRNLAGYADPVAHAHEIAARPRVIKAIEDRRSEAQQRAGIDIAGVWAQMHRYMMDDGRDVRSSAVRAGELLLKGAGELDTKVNVTIDQRSAILPAVDAVQASGALERMFVDAGFVESTDAGTSDVAGG